MCANSELKQDREPNSWKYNDYSNNNNKWAMWSVFSFSVVKFLSAAFFCNKQAKANGSWIFIRICFEDPRSRLE
jgi:hypothetical protein